MAKWASSATLQNGPNYIKSNATKMVAIKAYTANDSYATVMGNAVAEADMVSGDYVFSNSGANQLMTTAAGKTGVASAGSGASPDLHYAFTNGSSTVYWVTDEPTDQVITAGNTVNFGQCTYTATQPT